MKMCCFNVSQNPGAGNLIFRRSEDDLRSARSIRSGTPAFAAFTLLELLVVIAIIGILAAIGLPKLSGFGKSNATIAATRQLLDDVSYARSRAIANRADVYIVFVPPAGNLPNNFMNNLPMGPARTLATNLMGSQFTTYALYSERNVGDQPGQRDPHYLTSWKTLPQGTFIATNKFSNFTVDSVTPFRTGFFPFPLATNAPRLLPYIAFDYQGKLVSDTDINGRLQDAIIPLARGSIFYDRDANGHLVAPFAADVLENPPGNSRRTNTTWNWIHINWLTGRARLERQEVQ